MFFGLALLQAYMPFKRAVLLNDCHISIVPNLVKDNNKKSFIIGAQVPMNVDNKVHFNQTNQ